ncbi:MAG: glycosyl hydrolase, partial [Chloroflexi bacterium]|nr:glycosyl hydrolase [Chloroflexota bacterium]
CLDLLLGDANPSGKLAETWPFSLADVPSSASYGQRYNTPYIESIFVGYRYYESAGIPVRFPFGHGLSYTSFAFSDLQASKDKLRPDENLLLKLKLTNTGTRSGKEVVQVYIAAGESAVFRASKELKAFSKVALQPGERTK